MKFGIQPWILVRIRHHILPIYMKA